MATASQDDRQRFCATAKSFGAAFMAVIPRDEDDRPLAAIYVVDDVTLLMLSEVLENAGITPEAFPSVAEGYSVLELSGPDAVKAEPIVEAWQSSLD